MRQHKVLPNAPRTKAEVRAKLSEAWGRTSKLIGGKGTMADRMGLDDYRTIDNALCERNLPEAQTIFNSLCADPSALDEVLALYGMRAVPAQSEAANDLHVIAELSGAASEWLNRLVDGVRCHRDTARLAELFRPLVCEMQAIIAEADRAKGRAA